MIASSLALLAVGPAPGQTPLQTCGFHFLPLVMEQVSVASWSYSENNDAMNLWNRYVDIYRYVPDDGTWGRNSFNEFAGFPTSAQLFSTWGFVWGANHLAATVDSYPSGCPCCPIAESDIAFNPARTWTTDRVTAETSPNQIHYLSVLLHELGHSWGYQRQNETYNYNRPSVMHSYYGSSVHPGLTIHAIDAFLFRALYGPISAPLPRADMATFSHYATGPLNNTYTTSSSYAAGSQITVHGITIENTGTSITPNAHLRLFLSTNRTITNGDTLLGDWTWANFGAASSGTYDLTGTIPLGTPNGTYWVGALVTSNGYFGDDIAVNDSTYLFAQVGVTSQPCNDDPFEPNNSSLQATTIVAANYPGLQVCPGNEDWFRVFVAQGQRLDVSIQFNHAAGDLDLELFSPALQLIDFSYSASNSETVTVLNAPAAGHYYARVFGFQGAPNLYSLSADLSAAATCTFRNGRGVNPTGFTCTTLPVLGNNWVTQVPTTTSTLQTLLGVALAPAPGTPFYGGELLLDLSSPPQIDSARGTHTVPIPNVPSFLGLVASSQGFRIDVSGRVASVVVFNAQDVRLGR
jgi:hypothetical protein